jgi:hypothetical protein
MDPATSTIIQSEPRYSREMARPILPVLQATWPGAQQHLTQFEQESGAVQFSQEVSAQPQDAQEKDERVKSGPH